MRKTKKRRGRGEGAIYQRDSDGRWVANVTVGYRAAADHPEKLIRIRKVLYGDTKEEVQQRLNELLQQRAAGTPDGATKTLKGGMDFWLDCNVKPGVDAATYALHKQRATDYVWPHLGQFPLLRITPFVVKDWFDRLEKHGCSADLRNKCGQLLRRYLDQCVRDGYIKSNPSRDGGMKLPRALADEMRPLDADQARVFLALAGRHRLAALWLLALDSGMRQGEMLALEWPDVDFANGTVSVTKSVRTGDRSGPRLKEVKTKAARRRIRLTRRTLEALAAHKKKRPAGPLVFSTAGRGKRRGTARYLNKANLRKSFRLLLRKADLPEIRFHDLRHTHATLALQATKNVKAVSARLGHADIRVTLNTYAHFLPIMEEEYVAAMERLLETPPAPPSRPSQIESANGAK